MASASPSALPRASCSCTRRRPHSPLAPILSSAASTASPWPTFLPLCVGASFAPASFFRSSTCTRAGDVSTGAGCRRITTADGLSLFGANKKMLLGTLKASSSGISPSNGSDGISDAFEGWKTETSSKGTAFLGKLAIALGIAATITVLSICFKGPSFVVPSSLEDSSSLVWSTLPARFTLSIFGYKVVLPEYTPGWVYFWLLMAAGCGLFISEEALNVWVGISLARTLALDGTWKSFVHSFSNNAPYIMSTVFWVYWGVCISDMIPFYLGKLFRQTKASVDICSKLGIGKDKVVSITRTVQKYSNMIGFVERFSVGVRNPTSFLAGTWGISAECFFAGVCCGGLITLPIQLGIGFLLRERPMMALAGVATAVGIWTVFPYILAASVALFIYLRQLLSNSRC